MNFFFTGDGELDKIELQNALKIKLNITSKDIHQKDIRGLFELIDSDGSHSIDKMEFVSIFGLAAESQIAQDAKKSGTLKMYISSFEKICISLCALILDCNYRKNNFY